MSTPATPAERICAALDFPSLREAEPFARSIAPQVGMLKVGLELFLAEGPAAVRAIAALGRPVFLDAKLHDIPNTVEGAARGAAATGPAEPGAPTGPPRGHSPSHPAPRSGRCSSP